MAVTIQWRRDTAANWTSTNPTLLAGEPGFETDTGKLKIGNGSTAWTSLAYVNLSGSQASALFTATTDPSAPSAGTLIQYVKSLAGRLLPKFIGPSGLDTPFQPSLFSNGMSIALPGTSTALSYIGMGAMTAVGTVSHPALAATDFVQQCRRAIVTSAATTPSASELRYAATQVWRGNGAGLGGFFLSTRFAITSAVATQQLFVGLMSATGATSTSQVPSALTNVIGVGWNSADANMCLLHNDGAGACTKVGLGANFVKNQVTHIYELNLFCVPNASEIGWRVKNLTTGNETSGSITNNDIPANTTFLTYHAYANNGATAAAVVLNFLRFYLESDN